MKILILILFSSVIISLQGQVLLPIEVKNRSELSQLKLTPIGAYGILRKARKTIPAHLHTGIDIRRPATNYINEPVFPIAEGRVISIRSDGAYAQIIIEHKANSLIFWSLYEHIAGIVVNVNDWVVTAKPLARFMNRNELNHYGWQFDHFHLEILKVRPTIIKPDKVHPQRFFSPYSLTCFNKEQLIKYYYNPIEFFKTYLHK